jgi:hypothetical protein
MVLLKISGKPASDLRVSSDGRGSAQAIRKVEEVLPESDWSIVIYGGSDQPISKDAPVALNPVGPSNLDLGLQWLAAPSR